MQELSRHFLRIAAVTSVAISVMAAPAASETNAPVGTVRAARPRSIAARTESGAPVIARDVSFPQCYGPLPRLSSADFAVLGTNDGISFTRNACLVRQLEWAKRLPLAPAFYANTGNPGPQRAKHWPLGQTSPKSCSASAPNSIGCSYDYGWNAAWDSYHAATDAAQRLHRVDRADARHRAANVEWWLDVETMNSWQTVDGPATRDAELRDVATIQGEIDALRIIGVESVGIYSTAYQWRVITGGRDDARAQFAGVPLWLAGYGSRAEAIEGCGDASFTGGPLRMTQYLGRDGFDADVLCVTPGND